MSGRNGFRHRTPLRTWIGGSLFLRFFGSFAATMLAIWIGVIAYEAVVLQKHFERVQEIQTRAWSRQILAAVRAGADDPVRLRRTVDDILRTRDDMYRETGYGKPYWRLRIERGATLLYVLDGAPDHVLSGGLNTWVAKDPDTGVSVRLSEEVVIAWRFALAGTNHQFEPLLYSFPFLLLTAWFSIRRGLRPVRAIVTAIEARSTAQLSPLPSSPYRELAPLVGSVNRLMTRLSERMAREREFLSDAAHQLKTPLAVIQANAELLVALMPDPPPPGAHAVRSGLEEGVEDAAHVTHQLLALARSDGDLDTRTLATGDLAELLRTRLALAAAPAMRRGIEIALQAPESCLLPFHRESIAALIDNLVDNAVKYSADGGTVDVVLECDADSVAKNHAGAEAPRYVRLSISDQGPGIPHELREQVFERFFRVPGQDQPGSGLGLAIVSRAARVHGARVWLDDNPHVGRGGPGLQATVEWPR